MKKAVFFALIFGIVLTIPLDYLAHVNGSWAILAPGYRILTYIPLVDFLWAFLIVYLIVMHHEGLVHHHFSDSLLTSRTKLFMNAMISIVVIFFVVYVRFHEYMKIDYFYLKAGIVSLMLPTFMWVYKKTKILLTFLKTAMFFALTSMLHEIIALNNNHWIFPISGRFIGYMPFFNHTIPIEEYLFFFIMLSMGILTYYEFFEEARYTK